MTRALDGLVFGLAATIGVAASAAEPPTKAPRRPAMPVEGVISNPDWAAVPNGEIMAGSYPRLARFLELRGHVRMQCTVTTVGTLEGCSILDETPSGVGFGDAALSIAQYFRMKPKTVDGVAVSGGTVIIPIGYRLPDSQIEAPETDGPPPSAEALALGRRLFDLSLGVEKTAKNYRANVARLRSQAGPDAETPQGKIMFDAVDKAADGASESYAETMAASYARVFSIDQMKATVAFLESPAGQAWIAGNADLGRSAGFAYQRGWRQMLDDARRDFCKTTTCIDDAAGPSAPAAPAAK